MLRRIPLLLLLFLPFLPPAPSTASVPTSETTTLTLPPAKSFLIPILPPPKCTPDTPCTALLDLWIQPSATPNHTNITTTTTASVLHARPFLSARVDKHPPLNLRTALDLLYHARRTADNQTRFVADVESFLTDSSYAFIQLPQVHSQRHWFVRLLNAAPLHYPPMHANLRLQFADLPNPNSTTLLCPRAPRTHASACSQRGTCAHGICQCPDRFDGRYCQALVQPLPRPENVVRIPPNERAYFSYRVPQLELGTQRSDDIDHIALAVVLTIVSANPNITAPSITPVAPRPFLVAKRRGENGGNIRLPSGMPLLPSEYDLRFADTAAFVAAASVHTVVRQHVRVGDAFYIAVFNFASTKDANLHATIRAFPCLHRRTLPASVDANDADPTTSSLPDCPVPMGQQNWLTISFMLLPFLLGTLALFTIIICLSVWATVCRRQVLIFIYGHTVNDIDEERQTGETSTSNVDKLSDAEVEAMFPAFPFTKHETGALAAAGHLCCSVCLCTFDEGDMLRRLACAHTYHSACLDQWLRTNATCPRCRKSARITADSTRSSWLSRLSRSRRWLARVRWRNLMPAFLARAPSSRAAATSANADVEDVEGDRMLLLDGETALPETP